MRTGRIIAILSLICLFFSINLSAKEKLSGEAKRNLRSGNIYYDQSNFEKALGFYDKVLEEFPNHIESLKRSADINMHLIEKNQSKTVELYSKCFDIYKKTVALIMALPDEERKDMDMQTILEDSQKKVKSCWAKIFIYGQNLSKDGAVKEAIEVFTALDKLAPDSLKTITMIAILYQENNEEDKAIEMFKEIHKKNPTDYQITTKLANYYYEKPDYPLALQYYQELNKMNALDPMPISFMGYTYLKMEKNNEALEAFKQAILLDGKNTDLLSNAANLATNLGKNAEAVVYLKQLVEAEDTVDNLTIISYNLFKMKNYKETMLYAERWYEKDNSSKEAVQLIVMAAQQLKDKAKETKYNNTLKGMK